MQKKLWHSALAHCKGERREAMNYHLQTRAHRFEAYCTFFGISRQGYYQHQEHERAKESLLMRHCVILSEVRVLRKRLPRLGARKLFHCLHERVPAILVGIGRDAFFDLLREEGLLIASKKVFRVKTTDSRHPFGRYADLYNEHRSKFVRPFMVVVADITYIHTLEGFGYAAIITDVVSRMVVGFDLSASLSVESSLRAA